MKAKVTLRDNYSGRNINVICNVDNIALNGQPDHWCYNIEYLDISNSQFSDKTKINNMSKLMILKITTIISV